MSAARVGRHLLTSLAGSGAGVCGLLGCRLLDEVLEGRIGFGGGIIRTISQNTCQMGGYFL